MKILLSCIRASNIVWLYLLGFKEAREEKAILKLHRVVGCPRGVMIKAMDCEIVVSEFVLQSRYYVHFRPNTLGKGMNPLILPDMG